MSGLLIEFKGIKIKSVAYSTFFYKQKRYNKFVINMKVKIFDEEHESDLEKSINDFLDSEDIDVIDIKFQTAIFISGEEQIYCFSAMIIYT